jgi:hypothetical protein
MRRGGTGGLPGESRLKEGRVRTQTAFESGGAGVARVPGAGGGAGAGATIECHLKTAEKTRRLFAPRIP